MLPCHARSKSRLYWFTQISAGFRFKTTLFVVTHLLYALSNKPWSIPRDSKNASAVSKFMSGAVSADFTSFKTLQALVISSSLLKLSEFAPPVMNVRLDGGRGKLNLQTVFFLRQVLECLLLCLCTLVTSSSSSASLSGGISQLMYLSMKRTTSASVSLSILGAFSTQNRQWTWGEPHYWNSTR